MATPSKPSFELASKVLPGALLRVLNHIFSQGIDGCVLAGGTSLAGYYAGHRRSDDIDLFTVDESHQKSSVLAVISLKNVGVSLQMLNESAQYFEAIGTLDGHSFKVTSVVDANLFRAGQFVVLPNKVCVVDLDTLFKMKAATLVSRCSEKDLYDLIWLFGHYSDRTFADLISLGHEIDGGVEGEAIVSSVSGAILRKEACGFSLDPSLSADRVYREIISFKARLQKGIMAYLAEQPAPPLGELIQKLDRVAKKG